MTAADHLAQILAQIEESVPPGPDPVTHRAGCVIGVPSAVLVRAAQLIELKQYDIAADLITLGNGFAVEAFKQLVEDRRAEGKRSLAEILEAMKADNDRSDTRIVAPTAQANNAISPDELVALGVIDDPSQIQPQSQQVDFEFIGFVGHTPSCPCGDPSIVTWFGIAVGDHRVDGESLCEACMKDFIDECHEDPFMYQAAQIVFVRQTEPRAHD